MLAMDLKENKSLNIGLLIVATIVVAKLLSALLMPKSRKRLPPTVKSWLMFGGLARFLGGRL